MRNERSRFHPSQKRVGTGWQGEASSQTTPGLTAESEADQPVGVGQTSRGSGMRDDGRQTFAKDDSLASGRAAPEAPNGKTEDNLSSLPREIGDRAEIATSDAF